MSAKNRPACSSTQVTFLDAQARAAAQGWKVGQKFWRFAARCPYSRHEAPLRSAWQEGFTQGRREAGLYTMLKWNQDE